MRDIAMQMKRATDRSDGYLSLIGFVYSALTDSFQYQTEPSLRLHN